MRATVLDAILSWPTLFVPLLVFGFGPRAALRLIVLAFHRDDPRRRELLAELHAVPRLERPLWVMEQLEVALVEGLGERIVSAATGRLVFRWHLDSGVKLKRAYPNTFWIPDDDEKASVQSGDTVRLIFVIEEQWGESRWGERMWVEVLAVKRRYLIGRLKNDPVAIPRLYFGDKVKFKRDHIIDIHPDDDSGTEPGPDCSPSSTESTT
jgi:hypothetical protein